MVPLRIPAKQALGSFIRREVQRVRGAGAAGDGRDAAVQPGDALAAQYGAQRLQRRRVQLRGVGEPRVARGLVSSRADAAGVTRWKAGGSCKRQAVAV